MFNRKWNVTRPSMCNIEELVRLMVQWIINKYYIFWSWICRLRYPACNVHAPFCLPSAWLYKIFNIISYTAQFYKTSFDIKVWFDFLYNISHSKKKCVEIWWKMCIGLHVNYPSFLSDFNENFFYIFSNNTVKFHENLYVGSQVVHADRETARQTWRS